MSYFKQLTPEELEKLNSKQKSNKKEESKINLENVKLDDKDPKNIFDYSKILIPTHKKVLTKKLKQITKQIENYDKNIEKLKDTKADIEKELKIIENIQQFK